MLSLMNKEKSAVTTYPNSDGSLSPDLNIHYAVSPQTKNRDLSPDGLNFQLEELSEIIRDYNTFKFNDRASQLACICSLMMQVFSDVQRERILQVINQIGYEPIQKAFIALNQVCEDIFREKEDLFGILKRHRLNYPLPENDSMKFYRIAQFLNVTLIHFHMQKKKGFRLTDLQQKIKWESAQTLGPLLEKLIQILKEEILFRQ